MTNQIYLALNLLELKKNDDVCFFVNTYFPISGTYFTEIQLVIRINLKMERIMKESGFEPILEKILKFSDTDTLLSCFSVNKYWNKVVQNPRLWFAKFKSAKMPEEILQKWKELVNTLQANIKLSKTLTKCMVKVLINHKTHGFCSPEIAASKYGLVPILRFMATYTEIDFRKVETNANSKNNYSGIHWGVGSGKVEILKYLHELGYDLNIPIYDEWTPFLLAVWYERIEVIDFLSSVLENPISRLWHDRTVFHVAADHGRHESLKCLLKIKNDPNVKMLINHPDLVGATPLHMAAEKGHLESVKVLTSHGASTDCTRSDGYTPLHLAAKKGHLKIVEYLTSIMENVNQKIQASNILLSNLFENKNNYTALQLAAENGHAEVFEILAKFVDNPN